MKKTAPLSKREDEIWIYLLRYFMDHGYSPTHQEIAEHMKFQGKNKRRQATDCLHNMRDKGWIKFSGKKYRNIIDPKLYRNESS